MAAFRLSAEGAVAAIEIDRPPVNVLDAESLRELATAVAALSAGTRALRLTGRPHFSAGVDVADHRPEKTDAMLAAIHDFLATLLNVPFPTLATVRGACLGGGAEIALACDVVFAAEDSRIGFPEITLAAFPPAAVLMLPGLAGSARAAQWVLSGAPVSGREAASSGFIARAVPERDLDAAGEAFLRDLASKSAPAANAACLLLREPKRRAFEDGRKKSEAAYRRLLGGPDLANAVEAFLKRRGGGRAARMGS